MASLKESREFYFEDMLIIIKEISRPSHFIPTPNYNFWAKEIAAKPIYGLHPD